VISIVGNAKNAGKTTVLNTLIEAYQHDPIAITSIGLDGEMLDQITRLPKPRITVYPGMLVATAKDTLRQATADYDVIETLDISSALGPIVIVLVRSLGHMICAGPSQIRQLKKLVCRLKQMNLTKIFIDGAFARQQLSRLGDATILCVGASSAYQDDQVIQKSLTLIHKFSLPGLPMKYQNLPPVEEVVGLDEGGNILDLPFDSTISIQVETVKKIPVHTIKAIYFPHAVSESFCQAWLSQKKLHTIAWMIQSPSHLICSERTFEKLRQIDQSIFCQYPVHVVCVCYNPFRPNGEAMNSQWFYQELRSQIEYPVYNVLHPEVSYESIDSLS